MPLCPQWVEPRDAQADAQNRSRTQADAQNRSRADADDGLGGAA